MVFNTAVTTQSSSTISLFQKDLNLYFSDKAEVNPIAMRFACPLIIVTNAVIEVAKIVCMVVESLFKGLMNVIGGPCSKKCSILRGLKQLVLAPFKVAIYAILLSPVYSLGSGLALLIGPEFYRRFTYLAFEKTAAITN